MMVIDFHVHVGTRFHWTPWVIQFFRETNPYYYTNFSDRITPEGVIDYLRSQGIHQGVVLSEYAPETSGVVTNEYTAAFCAGREELIPFGSICLYEGAPVAEQAERAVTELGMRGFKMLPTYAHFFPNDRILYDFYEVAQAHGVPLQFHTGISIFKGSRVKYGDPLLLDDVAGDFPSLKIILDHGGRSFWYDRAGWMITRHRNVHIGIAGVPAKQLLTVFPLLQRYPDRFIFGSDWPGVPDIKPLVEKILALPLTAEVSGLILAENAKRLLGL